MNTSTSLIEGVVIMLAIISLSVFLKKINVLKKEHSLLFSGIVLHITLPAIIFSSLATQSFNIEYIKMAGIMAVIEITIIFIAWFMATVLRFERGEKGALILVSAFGMTAMLGYPIIRQVFPGNPLAMEEAVVTSEFGVGLLLFILGPIIAMYYGDSKVQGNVILGSIKKFFTSPIFISMAAGILVSFIPINADNQIFKTSIRFFHLIGNANLLMVAFTIGLLVEFKKMNHLFIFLGIAIFLKLIIKPLMAYALTSGADFTDMMREIVFIETALPSAILGVVFAKQYNCRPDLVSLAIMLSLALSVVSVSLLFFAFF